MAFPVQLDMTRYIQESTIPSELSRVDSTNENKYELSVVLVHEGVPSFGHYWVYIRNGTQWLKFNDSLVTEVISKCID
jgi:ubiquitin C-terminal hydrolase